MEKILMAPLSITYMSRDSMKLALKVAHIYDLEEDQQLSAAQPLNLDEETRQKLLDLQKDLH